MTEVIVEVGGQPTPLAIRINGRAPTFTLGTERLEAQLLAEIGPRYLDFLEIAAAVFAAESSVGRGGAVRAEMGTAWRRSFRFRIPVRDPDFWSSPELTSLLTRTVSFLTDDDYAFTFDRLTESGAREPYLDLDPQGAQFPADEIVLFSGGLDSFAGALDLLETTKRRLVLVTHRSAQKVIPRQVRLGDYLAKRYPGRVKHLHLTATRKGSEGKDTTQRSRTLLFTAIAAAVCQGFGARRISFFENGIVSHNLPISHQVVGTMATRTTHPLVLALLDDLVVRLDGDGDIRICNPFEWLTKREVVSLIREHDHGKRALKQIGTAVSCTLVRDQSILKTHCGACSQCLDRRFALIGAGLEAFDPVESYHIDVLHGERTLRHDKVMALEWTRHAGRMARTDESGLMDRFGLEIARIAEGFPALPMREVIARSVRMHRAHGETVMTVVASSMLERLGVGQPVPSSSLLGLYAVGGVPDEDPAVAERSGDTAMLPHDAGTDARDVIPDPDAPLTVAFYRDESGIACLKVEGLCDIRRDPAEVAHKLKPAFDADRAEGKAPEDHRFVATNELWADRGKASIRQNVKRCRQELADAYGTLHGRKPGRHLLIENRRTKGYRLDPAIRLVTRERITRP